ncbi:MAG: SseB family protein [Planctomycetota bacterium]
MLEEQIAKAHANPSEIGELCRLLAQGHVVIIASWSSPDSNQIAIQNFFKKNGTSFIPLFSDETHFRSETSGSGFEDKAVSVECNLLMSILNGEETLILNPGSRTPVEFRKSDFEPYVKPITL